jgi:hypothetical protein
MRVVKTLLAILAALLIALASAAPIFADVEVLGHRQAEWLAQPKAGHKAYDPAATPKVMSKNAWKMDHPANVRDRMSFYDLPVERAFVVRWRLAHTAKSGVGLRLFIEDKDMGERIVAPQSGYRYVYRTWQIPDVQPTTDPSGTKDSVDIKLRTTRMDRGDAILIDKWSILGNTTEG